MRAHRSAAHEAQPSQRPPAEGWYDMLANGTPVWIRPICREDAQLERTFLAHLSEQGRHDRFVGVVQPPSEAVAQHLTDVKNHGHVALIALVREGDHDREVGAGGYFVTRDGKSCHAAIAVDDAWRKLGIGTLIARHMIDMARAAGLQHAFVVDPVGREGHHRLAQHLGFRSCPDPEDPVATVFKLDL